MSDPSKSYHFEIVCDLEEQAEYLRELMLGFDLDGKVVQRKKHYIVYLKEGSQIVDILNVMEAHVALMEFENITYAPIDLDAIDPDLLSAREKKMLNDYHKMVYDTISPYMTAEENEWLKRYTRAI